MKRHKLCVAVLVGLAICYGCMNAVPVYAQNGGIAFSAGPTLFVARMSHAAFVLPDGRVVLAGGHGTDFVPLASAEIWNPATSAHTGFTTVSTHDNGAVAKLSDGRYILAGGSSDSLGVGYSVTAEIFDPANDSFTATGNMHYARTSNSAATLSDGRVLTAGCWYNATSAAYGDLFDPTTNTFTATGALNTARSNPRVLPTADGKAVVFGGMGTYGSPYIEQVELYDPDSNSFSILQDNLLPEETGWVTLGSMGDTNGNLVDAQKLPDGRYLFLAVNTSLSSYALVTFNPATKAFAKFETSPPLPSNSAVSLLNPLVDTSHNTVYLLAQDLTQSSGTLPIQTRVYRINLATGVRSDPAGTSPLDGYLGSVGLNLLQDGRLFVSGGNTRTDYYYNFYPTDKTFLGDLIVSVVRMPPLLLLMQ
ncbi:MAG: Kelch repeat-containing protein [Solidesulfovibrio sp. DCME]|uniref:Kelch repeat-containing protein n=1 Tax=Solidesulfovibrio sp. DCME TaxID=3447380 RepID=UPI003D15117A